MVDAAMRELWHTGWMHQSMRMLVASFLVEVLGIDWREGHRWFHHTLVDQDPAINAMMWQNAGRSGVDQWNFKLDPTSNYQDPHGTYVRRWVNELEQLPNKYLFTPWRAPSSVLEECGVVLGSSYPHRVVQDIEHAQHVATNALIQHRNQIQGKSSAGKAAVMEDEGEEERKDKRGGNLDEMIDDEGYDMVYLSKEDTFVRVFTRRELRKGATTTGKLPPSSSSHGQLADEEGGGHEKKNKKSKNVKEKNKNKNKNRRKTSKGDSVHLQQQERLEAKKQRQQKKRAKALHAKFKEKTRGKLNARSREDLED